jgi:hypothetical protein
MSFPRIRSYPISVLPRAGSGTTVVHGPFLVAGGRVATHSDAHSPHWIRSAVPFKYHAEHRHHIPKPRYRVTNWAEYDTALKRRGSVAVWLCVQRGLACSAGDKPAGVEVRAP